MRKLLIVVGAAAGVVVLAIIAIFLYAYFNLNSIIAANRGYILSRASAALGRPIELQDIKASVGWGVKMDLKDVKVGDDTAFSQLPFLQARDVYVNVELWPLLSHSLKVTSLIVSQPQLRVLRNSSGVLNISTIGKPSGESPKPPGQKPAHTGANGSANPAGLAAVMVRSLKIQNGSLFYQDNQSGGQAIQVNRLNLGLDNFSVYSPFDVAISMAALGPERDVFVNGQAGPLMNHGVIDTSAVPLNLDATIGPLTIAQIKTIPQLAHTLPAGLSVSQPLTLYAKVTGTTTTPDVHASSDLTADRVVYSGIMDKPTEVPLKFDGTLSSTGKILRIENANVVLASMQAKATNMTLQRDDLAGRIDTNDFDLAPLGEIITPVRRYSPSGDAEIHSTVRLANHQPSADGSIKLTKVNLKLPGATVPPMSNLSGIVWMNGNSARVGPLTFNLGTNPATLQAMAQSLQPLRATYRFSAAAVNLGDLVPSRKALNERVEQLAAKGELQRAGDGALSATANLTSAQGLMANVPFQHLVLIALYNQPRLTINSLTLDAFGGDVGASGFALLAGDHNFDLKLRTDHIDVQHVMAAENAKAANTLRGKLTGNVQVAGAGSSFDRIRPTLRGNGAAKLEDGKLVGVNVVAQALQKIDNLPGIGSLVPAAVVGRHPELFRTNDTDIQHANLTFVLHGPRLITHDLTLAAADYSVLGDGWFDMDKNVDLTARILLSQAFSGELVSARRNVAFLETPDARIEIPLRVMGQLPKPAVVPDVGILVQRAASHVLQNKLGGLLGKKGGGLGGLLGGGGNGAAPSSNPLNQLKGLLQ